MRTLASLGVFAEVSNHRFSLTPLGEALKTGTPGRASVLTLAGELFTKSLDQLPYSVQTGKSGFEKATDGVRRWPPAAFPPHRAVLRGDPFCSASARCPGALR
jgi:hypothetical protein